MDKNFNTWNKYWQSKNYEINENDNIELRNEIIKYDVNKKKIIEIGSGRGLDAIALAKLGAEVYVLDYVEEALQITKKIADAEKVTLKYINADARSIPYEDNFFDIVFHLGVLEHFKDPIPILKEQFRVLKQGGLVFISVPQTYTLYTIKKHFLQLFGYWFAGWESQYSPKKLKSVVELSGFKTIKIFGHGYYPNFLWRIFGLDSSTKWNTIIPKFLMQFYKKILDPFRNSKYFPYMNLNVAIIGLKKDKVLKP